MEGMNCINCHFNKIKQPKKLKNQYYTSSFILNMLRKWYDFELVKLPDEEMDRAYCEDKSSPALTRGTPEYRRDDGKPPDCERG